MFSYWTLRSFSAPVRSGLDTSSSTCCTCWTASCACSSCTSWGRDRKCVSHRRHDGGRGGSAWFWFSTWSWVLLRNSISSCSDSILRSRWTRVRDASSTSCKQEVMSHCLMCYILCIGCVKKMGAPKSSGTQDPISAHHQPRPHTPKYGHCLVGRQQVASLTVSQTFQPAELVWVWSSEVTCGDSTHLHLAANHKQRSLVLTSLKAFRLVSASCRRATSSCSLGAWPHTQWEGLKQQVVRNTT